MFQYSAGSFVYSYYFLHITFSFQKTKRILVHIDTFIGLNWSLIVLLTITLNPGQKEKFVGLVRETLSDFDYTRCAESEYCPSSFSCRDILILKCKRVCLKNIVNYFSSNPGRKVALRAPGTKESLSSKLWRTNLLYLQFQWLEFDFFTKCK